MREIKFRTFYDGRMHDNVEATRILYNNSTESSLTPKYPIMQYTGITDKNGKEIYEGDIFKIERMSVQIFEVRYSDGFEFNHEWYGATFILYRNDGYTEVGFPFDETAMEFGEVIGNIYENPEP